MLIFVQKVCSPPLGSEDESPQTGGQVMTNEQKERITVMRQDGCGYLKSKRIIIGRLHGRLCNSYHT